VKNEAVFLTLLTLIVQIIAPLVADAIGKVKAMCHACRHYVSWWRCCFTARQRAQIIENKIGSTPTVKNVAANRYWLTQKSKNNVETNDIMREVPRDRNITMEKSLHLIYKSSLNKYVWKTNLDRLHCQTSSSEQSVLCWRTGPSGK